MDQGERGGMYRRQARRKSNQRALKRMSDSPLHKTIRQLRKKEEELEDWAGTSEEEKQESECATEGRREDSLYSQFVKLNIKKFSRLLTTFDLLK